MERDSNMVGLKFYSFLIPDSPLYSIKSWSGWSLRSHWLGGKAPHPVAIFSTTELLLFLGATACKLFLAASLDIQQDEMCVCYLWIFYIFCPIRLI